MSFTIFDVIVTYVILLGVFNSCIYIFADCIKGDDVGARECNLKGADSDSSRGGTIVTAHVDQATYPSDTIDRTIAFVDDTCDTLSSAHRKPRLLISEDFFEKRV